MKQVSRVGGVILLSLLSQLALADDPSWSAPHAPYQITDNIYAVGTEGIGVYLITTPKGHILLDASTEQGANVVEANIKSLGFKLTDIKYLIENHAHSDHVGGLAQLKKSTGATIVASQGDRYSLEHGTLDSETNWEDKFTPVKVEKIIADGEKISVGGVQLQAVLTPGHTKGCTSWFMQSPDNGAVRKVAFVCSLTTAGNKLVNNKIYPQIADDFRNTFAKLKTQKADLLLIGHPDLANLEGKSIAKKNGKTDAFVDSTELQKFVKTFEDKFEKELMPQQNLKP
ncbi:subclass B3 metallo-beta-lactamase [Cellvibrio sp.]|uniref:subclass B3 metallo-beta-lactamase n=1 Tax=Cellvibrio sp. TaxID=1965322 RepID=UPI0039648750